MNHIWKRIEDEPPTVLQPAARNYVMMGGKPYPRLKIAVCHERGNFYIAVYQKDSWVEPWNRDPTDKWPIYLIGDVLHLLQIAEDFLNPSNPYADRPALPEHSTSGMACGDVMRMRGGHTEFKVLRVEGSSVVLQELQNDRLFGPELHKTTGDMIYLEKVEAKDVEANPLPLPDCKVTVGIGIDKAVGHCSECFFYKMHEDGEQECDLMEPIDHTDDKGRQYFTGYQLENDTSNSVSSKCPLREKSIHIRLKE